jgi:predicted ribosomally synthesized peptide with SipW-like signal peptide
MKNMFLCFMVVSALAVGSLGGTMATWSDSETSEDNSIITGSLDLKVNQNDDAPWGSGIGKKVELDCMIPCKYYGPFLVELWNAGQCEFPSHAYIHFKDYECSNALPKENTGYPCPVTGDLKPEPELVAEQGGKVNCVTVPGIGILGDDCTLGDHIGVYLTLDNPAVDPTDMIFLGKLGEIVCQEIYLFDLMPCEPRNIYLYFHLQQPSEEDFGLNLIPNEGEAGYDEMHWKKFNDWPSWALMKDVVTFDVEFDLWLEDTPGGIVSP